MRHLKSVFAVCLSMIVLCAVTARAADKVVPEKKMPGHTVIRINQINGLDPKQVTVKQGTTVIWMNHTDSLAEIQFTGKAVTVACKSPTHFIVDENGSFVSDRIPPSSVASLCFVEKGTFNYVLQRGPRRTSDVKTNLPDVSGTIVVE